MQDPSTTIESSDADEDSPMKADEINESNLHLFVTMIETLLYVYEHAHAMQEKSRPETQKGGDSPGLV